MPPCDFSTAEDSSRGYCKICVMNVSLEKQDGDLSAGGQKTVVK